MEQQSEQQCEQPLDDPVFAEEQEHLGQTYETLKEIGGAILKRMDETGKQAAADKQSMGEELTANFATYADAMETYAEFATMNRVVDAYNQMQEADRQRLDAVELLLRQPYFAKVVIQLKNGREPKELYIGNAGISDDSYHRMVVDWRSPVAEVYYNQENGETSYEANGRTIHCDLQLRRQFDIEGKTLNAYFDTTVAIQDSLLLASLSRQRSAHMKAITATIQREQNQVIRHEDVPTLLVNGIAGSGKTSVLMQRIAYLFYRNRETLKPDEVFLISPNPVFSRYIDNVLPDMGETNPHTLTWKEFASHLLPESMGTGSADVEAQLLDRIDEATQSFELDANDYLDIEYDGVVLVSAKQIAKIASKFPNIPAGSHLITLMREEILSRVEARLAQLAGEEDVWDEVAALGTDEQLRLFHETVAAQTEEEERAYALTYLQDKFASAVRVAERDEWLRIERIGKRLLGVNGLAPTAWLYLKMAVTGMSNPYAKYVMIDEMQDYTVAQLAVLARYFRRANFLLLGDRNQAITEGTASYDEIRKLFERMHGPVSECQLMTSYRSTPEITQLFARLLSDEERMNITSIQRSDAAPTIIVADDKDERIAAVRKAMDEARADEGLTAVIVPYAQRGRQVQKALGENAPALIDDASTLPESGIVIVPLKYAKGLEFDRVIIPDAGANAFPDEPLARRCLYTTLSRATKNVVIIAQNDLSPLLRD